MSTPSSHTMKRSMRGIIATMLMVIYLMISLSPLASLAMYSKSVAHTVTGECSGDCSICGCSPESRANHTCCCARKRQQAHAHEDDAAGTPACCKKKPVNKTTVIASCGCPCGNGKQAVLSAVSMSELMPFHFTEQFTIPHTDTIFSTPPQRLTSRVGDPPDPPPKLLPFC